MKVNFQRTTGPNFNIKYDQNCDNLRINEIDCYSKSSCHSFNRNTLIGFEELGINNSSDLPHVIPEVRVQIAIQSYLLSQTSFTEQTEKNSKISTSKLNKSPIKIGLRRVAWAIQISDTHYQDRRNKLQ